MTDSVLTCKEFSLLKQFMEHIPDGVLIVRMDGVILSVNRRFLDLFGYEPKEILGQHLRVILPPKVREKHEVYFRDFFGASSVRPMGRPFDIHGMRKDGGLIAVDIQLNRAAPAQSEDGTTFLYCTAIIRDNTRSLAVNTALSERARESMEVFLRSTNHEIRTAMNAIFVSTSLLKENMSNMSPDQRECFDILEAGTAHMSKLVGDVLDLTKIQAGKVVLESIGFDLDEVLKKAVILNQTICNLKDIQFLLLIEPGIPRFVRGDPTRLSQIFQNLIVNGIKLEQ